jgi:sugar phosphate isomerase/epimerase
MGAGMVDWDRVFAGFAAGKFSGPLTLHVEYHATDEIAAIAKDFEFIRKQVEKAYTAG